MECQAQHSLALPIQQLGGTASEPLRPLPTSESRVFTSKRLCPGCALSPSLEGCRGGVGESVALSLSLPLSLSLSLSLYLSLSLSLSVALSLSLPLSLSLSFSLSLCLSFSLSLSLLQRTMSSPSTSHSARSRGCNPVLTSIICASNLLYRCAISIFMKYPPNLQSASLARAVRDQPSTPLHCAARGLFEGRFHLPCEPTSSPLSL
jgi:hypothetical protein